jgi:hypothetical protein
MAASVSQEASGALGVEEVLVAEPVEVSAVEEVEAVTEVVEAMLSRVHQGYPRRLQKKAAEVPAHLFLGTCPTQGPTNRLRESLQVW